ncbi:hypothetical protein WA556_001449 [Blastocystis sp. ATCC 50177/Nand II]
MLEGNERVEGSEKLEGEKKEEERLRREEEERKKKEEEEKERKKEEEKRKEEEKKQKEEKKKKMKEEEMKEEEKHSQKRNPSLPPPSPKKPNTATTPIFLFSGDTTPTTISQIEALHGKVIQTHDRFDSTATHFVTPSPKRTEKFLGSVACGLWVVKPSYLDECQKQGRFVEEGEFEWRDVEPGCNIDGGSIRRWRERGGKAFQDWLIVLVGDLKPTSDKWKRIVESAGGTVAITKKNVTAGVKALMEKTGAMRVAVVPDAFGKCTLTNQLKQHGFIFVHSNFLLDYLSKDPQPEVEA